MYSFFLFFLLTYLLTFFLSFLNSYLFTYFLSYFLSFLLIYFLSFLLTYLLTYFLTFFLTYLFTYFLIYFLSFFLSYLLTYSMEQNPSWEANRFSASQEIPCFLWNPKVHYRIHKCPPPVLIPSQLSPVRTHHPISLRSILILSSHLRLCLLSGLVPSDFPTKTLFLPLPIRATCPAHRILLNFITRTILVEEYRSLSSSLCSFIHSPVTSSLLGPNILLDTLFSNTLSLRSSVIVSDQVSHPYKTTGKIMIAIR